MCKDFFGVSERKLRNATFTGGVNNFSVPLLVGLEGNHNNNDDDNGDDDDEKNDDGNVVGDHDDLAGDHDVLGEVRTARIFKLLLNVLAPVAHLVRGPFVAMLMFGKENQQRGRIVDKPSKCSIRSFPSVLRIMPQFSGTETMTIDHENM